jgi:hypothetical protein
MELYVTQRAVEGGTETESRQRPQGYWVRHAQKCDVCLVASTDRGGALDTSLRLSVRGHPAPTHPAPTANLVNINKP